MSTRKSKGPASNKLCEPRLVDLFAGGSSARLVAASHGVKISDAETRSHRYCHAAPARCDATGVDRPSQRRATRCYATFDKIHLPKLQERVDNARGDAMSDTTQHLFESPNAERALSSPSAAVGAIALVAHVIRCVSKPSSRSRTASGPCALLSRLSHRTVISIFRKRGWL
jgi:hypothetical protein